MSKTKSTSGNASPVKAEFMFGVDAFKTGFDKTAKLCESVGEFNKDTLEAYIESATVAGSGLQKVKSDVGGIQGRHDQQIRLAPQLRIWKRFLAHGF